METTMASPAAQVIIAIIPIVGIVIGGTLIFFYLLWRHREISLQIKAGTYQEKKFQLKIFSLFTGLILCGVGLILTIMFYVIQGLSYSLLGGLVPLVIGLCLILFYKLCPVSIEKDGEN